MKRTLYAALLAALLMPSFASAKDAGPLAKAGYQNELKGRYAAAIDKYRQALRTDRNNPVYFLHASRARLKMGELDRSAGNLHYAIKRARRIGAFSELAKRVRTHKGFKILLTADKNKRILDLYDSVEKGLISEAEAVERIEKPGEMRDALTGLKNLGVSLDETMNPPMDVDEALNALPERSQVVCMSTECARVRLDAAIERADQAFAAELFEEAAANYELALTISDLGATLSAKKRGDIFKRAGICLRRMGLVFESVKILQVAVRVLPNSVSAEYELAASHNLLGDEKRAMTRLEQALRKAEREGSFHDLVLRLKKDEDFLTARHSGRVRDLLAEFNSK